MNLYGIFKLFLALGAFITGLLMIFDPNGLSGIFPHEFPYEWLSKVPFNSWLIPGIFSILIFRFGNTTAAVNSFKKRKNSSGIIGIIQKFS